jgi:hypothetical protein
MSDDDNLAANYSRNQGYAQSAASYATTLSPTDEKKFLSWLQSNDVPFDPKEKVTDYDMRGFWQALQTNDPRATTAINPNDRQIHYPDYWKTPYHKSFSRESKWARAGAPSWNDQDQLVLPNGKIVFDERKQSAPMSGSDATSPGVASQINQIGNPLGQDSQQAFGGQQITFGALTQALNASALPPLPGDATDQTGYKVRADDSGSDDSDADSTADVTMPPAPQIARPPDPVSAQAAAGAQSDILSKEKQGQQIDQAMLDRLGRSDQAQSDLSADYLKSLDQYAPPAPPAPDPNPLQRLTPLLFLAAFGGKLTKLDANSMLAATNGMVNGFLKGDQQKYENAVKQYDQAYEQYRDRRANQKEIYDTLRTSYKDQVDGDIRALQAAHQMTGDQIQADQRLLDLQKSWQDQDTKIATTNAQLTQANYSVRARLKMEQDKAKAAQSQATLPPGFSTQDVQTVAGALNNVGIRVPAGMSGKAQITNTIPYIMDTPRQPGEDILTYAGRVAQKAKSGIIGTAAEKSSVTQLNTMLGATRQAVSQLQYNIGEVNKLLTSMSGSDISPVVNAIARGEEKWSGDPKYSSLFFFMYGVATESARILAGGQASRAQLHQGAAEEAQKWASINMTPASFMAKDGVGPAMIREGDNRIKNFEDAIAAQTGTAAPGKTRLYKDGKPYDIPDDKVPAANAAGYH